MYISVFSCMRELLISEGYKLENTTVVSNSPIHHDRLSWTHHSEAGANDQSESSPNVTSIRHVAYLRKRYRDQQLLKRLQTSCSTLGGPKPTNPMTHCFPIGVAGVLHRVQIPFLDLHITEVLNFLTNLCKESYQYAP